MHLRKLFKEKGKDSKVVPGAMNKPLQALCLRGFLFCLGHTLGHTCFYSVFFSRNCSNGFLIVSGKGTPARVRFSKRLNPSLQIKNQQTAVRNTCCSVPSVRSSREAARTTSIIRPFLAIPLESTLLSRTPSSVFLALAHPCHRHTAKDTGYRYIHYGDIRKQVADLIICDEQWKHNA